MFRRVQTSNVVALKRENQRVEERVRVQAGAHTEWGVFAARNNRKEGWGAHKKGGVEAREQEKRRRGGGEGFLAGVKKEVRLQREILRKEERVTISAGGTQGKEWVGRARTREKMKRCEFTLWHEKRV